MQWADTLAILIEKDLIASAKQCLDQLKKQPQKHFRVALPADDIDDRIDRTEELGQGGLALCINVDNKNYAIGWADSNNMEIQNTVRSYIVSKMNGDIPCWRYAVLIRTQPQARGQE